MLAGRGASPSGNLAARMPPPFRPGVSHEPEGRVHFGAVAPGHELPPLFDELVADHLNGEALEFPFRHPDVLRGHQRGRVDDAPGPSVHQPPAGVDFHPLRAPAPHGHDAGVTLARMRDGQQAPRAARNLEAAEFVLAAEHEQLPTRP